MRPDDFISALRRRENNRHLFLQRDGRGVLTVMDRGPKSGRPYEVYKVRVTKANSPAFGMAREPTERDLHLIAQIRRHHHYPELGEGNNLSGSALRQAAGHIVKRIYEEADERRDREAEELQGDVFRREVAPRYKWLADNWHTHGRKLALAGRALRNENRRRRRAGLAPLTSHRALPPEAQRSLLKGNR